MNTSPRLLDRLRLNLLPVPHLSSIPSAFDPENPGDHIFNPGSAPMRLEKLRAAAVLVGVVDDGGEERVLLTRRTEQLQNHSGQIALPGGKVDPEDADLAACALREAEEEIGLAPEFAEVLGAVETYVTISGFAVTPVVARIRPGFRLKPDPSEVAEAFEVPLAFLLDKANHRREKGTFNGQERSWWAMPYQGHYIWGATAGMLRLIALRHEAT